MPVTNRPAKLIGLVLNRNFLLLSSIALGFALGDVARWTEGLTVPALAAAMAVSLTQVASSAFRSWRRLIRAALVSLVLTYGVMGTVMLVLARLLMPDRELWIGSVLVAAVPSGVAVVPFSYILGGDTTFALLGSVGVYLAALVVTPLIILGVAGSSVLQPTRLAIILLQLIIVPLVLSRLVLASPLRQAAERWRGKVVNLAFALVVFTVVGVNRDLLVAQPQVLLLTALVAIGSNFGLALLLELVLRRMQIKRRALVSYILMGTLKNTGLAAATALALLGERASVPGAVASAVSVLYLLWLGVRWKGRE